MRHHSIDMISRRLYSNDSRVHIDTITHRSSDTISRLPRPSRPTSFHRRNAYVATAPSSPAATRRPPSASATTARHAPPRVAPSAYSVRGNPRPALAGVLRGRFLLPPPPSRRRRGRRRRPSRRRRGSSPRRRRGSTRSRRARRRRRRRRTRRAGPARTPARPRPRTRRARTRRRARARRGGAASVRSPRPRRRRARAPTSPRRGGVGARPTRARRRPGPREEKRRRRRRARVMTEYAPRVTRPPPPPRATRDSNTRRGPRQRSTRRRSARGARRPTWRRATRRRRPRAPRRRRGRLDAKKTPRRASVSTGAACAASVATEGDAAAGGSFRKDLHAGRRRGEARRLPRRTPRTRTRTTRPDRPGRTPGRGAPEADGLVVRRAREEEARGRVGRSERLERGDAPRVSDELRRGGAVRGVPEEDPESIPPVAGRPSAQCATHVTHSRWPTRAPYSVRRARGFGVGLGGFVGAPPGSLGAPGGSRARTRRGRSRRRRSGSRPRGTRRGRERAIADANRLARGRHRARVPGAGDARGGARRSRRAGGRRGFARRGDDGIREDARRTVVVHPKSAETLVHQGEVRVVREVRRRGGVARERGRGAAAREVGASGEPGAGARVSERTPGGGGGGGARPRRDGRGRDARGRRGPRPRAHLASAASLGSRRRERDAFSRARARARVVHRARPARRARAARPRLKIRFEPRRAFFRCSPDAARKSGRGPLLATSSSSSRVDRVFLASDDSSLTPRARGRRCPAMRAFAASGSPSLGLADRAVSAARRREASGLVERCRREGTEVRRAPPSPTPVPVTALTFSPFPSTPPSRRRRGACSTASPRASPA